MVRSIRRILIRALHVIEIVVAIFLTAAIAALVIGMIPLTREILLQQAGIVEFKHVIEYAFSIIIGIELIKLVCRPSAGNVVEVLMFSVARFLVIDHSSITTCLLGVVSIAILFATKKYLFCEIGHPIDRKDEKGLLFTLSRIGDKYLSGNDR